MVGAANYMYKKASVKGVGYKVVDIIVSTQEQYNGQKLVEKESGSGNEITEKTELEADRQLNNDGTSIGSKYDPEHLRNGGVGGEMFSTNGPKGTYFYPPRGGEFYLEDVAEVTGHDISELKSWFFQGGLFSAYLT